MNQTNKWDVLYKLVAIAGKITIAYIIFGSKKNGSSLITINFNGKKETKENAEEK